MVKFISYSYQEIQDKLFLNQKKKKKEKKKRKEKEKEIQDMLVPDDCPFELEWANTSLIYGLLII